MLIVQHHDAVMVQRGYDLAERLRVDGLSQVDSFDLRDESGVQRLHRDHDFPPSPDFCEVCSRKRPRINASAEVHQQADRWPVAPRGEAGRSVLRLEGDEAQMSSKLDLEEVPME